MTMAQFVNKDSVTETTMSTTVYNSLKLTVYSAVEVYKNRDTKIGFFYIEWKGKNSPRCFCRQSVIVQPTRVSLYNLLE